MNAFAHIDTWVFDMDDTLYDASTHVFPEMGRLMRVYMAEHLGIPEATVGAERERLWHKYGATLRGLMEEHGIEPVDFMERTHAIDVAHVPRDPALVEAVAALPGRKLLFTNSYRPFVDKVMAHLGFDAVLDGIFSVEDAGFWPKPHAATYEAFFKKFGVDPKAAAFFEDSEQNLPPAHARGMTTVWLTRHAEEGAELPYVHHRAQNLSEWLNDYNATLKLQGKN